MGKKAGFGNIYTIVTIPRGLKVADRLILSRLFPNATLYQASLGPGEKLELVDQRVRYGKIGVREFKTMLEKGPFAIKLVSDGGVTLLASSNGKYVKLALLRVDNVYNTVEVEVKRLLEIYDSLSPYTAKHAVSALMREAESFGFKASKPLSTLKMVERWMRCGIRGKKTGLEEC